MNERTVLVVDDELSVAKAASRLLRSMGFQVLVAGTGLEAIEICRSQHDGIDVILLDAFLDASTSIETLRLILHLRPAIKVILMSGYGKQESLEGFAGTRVDAFVPKPFGYVQLENAVRSVSRTDFLTFNSSQ